MNLQEDRRAIPYPWTWEIPALVVCLTALGGVIVVHVARSCAILVAGGGWEFTPRVELFSALPGLLEGDSRAGLDPGSGRASVRTLYSAIFVFEAAAVLGWVWFLRWGTSRWGAVRVQGMADGTLTKRLLGVSRLHRSAKVLRPDLPCHPRPRASELGWRIGTAAEPRTGQALWVPWDRTAGVIGPQGSGKTLDLLAPALLSSPGPAMVTLTKVDDLLLTVGVRSEGDRPVAVLDPFGLAPGLPSFVFDLVAGCGDAAIAERRAKAFTAGTSRDASTNGPAEVARFYAVEASKVLQAYFHAAALDRGTLDDVLTWVANPHAATEPYEILKSHRDAAPMWHGLLHGSLRGDDRTAANTIATVQQAMSLFFQAGIRERCVPTQENPATDVASLLERRGTIYLLGREDPYASASPLMTAAVEHILDTALALASRSPHGKLSPPLLAVLDELPSTAPIPTLLTRMANERALGISFIYAAQTWRQLAGVFGENGARALLGLTNVLCFFGGSKDASFNQEISDLLGQVRVPRVHWHGGAWGTRNVSADDIPVMTGAELRQLPERRALVVAENGKPIVAKLDRAIEGKVGRRLLSAQDEARARVAAARRSATASTWEQT